MIDPEKVRQFAKVVAKKLQGGMQFTPAAREALKGQVAKEDYSDYFPAIGAELSIRSRIAGDRRAPETPRPAPEKPPEKQLGFGFGERQANAPRIRPPIRRY